MDALIMSINDSCSRFTEMVRCQMVIMRTVGIWRMTVYIILSLLPLSLSSFWWSPSANKSLSENIDRENWISGWHCKLLKTECMRYLNLINLKIKFEVPASALCSVTLSERIGVQLAQLSLQKKVDRQASKQTASKHLVLHLFGHDMSR